MSEKVTLNEFEAAYVRGELDLCVNTGNQLVVTTPYYFLRLTRKDAGMSFNLQIIADLVLTLWTNFSEDAEVNTRFARTPFQHFKADVCV